MINSPARLLQLKPVFLALVLALGPGQAVALQHDHSHENSSSTEADNLFEQEQTYTCSMHPQVRSDDPNDTCPICGMDLIPVSHGGEEGDVTAIEFGERSLALLNLQTEPVIRTTPQSDLRLVGRLEYDETRLRTVSAWVGGRLDRLHINFVGAEVSAGEPIAEIYSPDLLVAQQELLQAHRQASSAAGPDFLRNSSQTTYQSSRERLRLLGLSAAQIDAIIERGEATDQVTIHAPVSGIVVARNVSEGDYVDTGTAMLELADLSKVWAVMDVYEKDLHRIERGQHLEVAMTSHPNQLFHGEVVSVEPRVNDERRTRQVRVELDNSDGILIPGSFTRATVRVEHAEGLVIPASAPLLTGKRAVVYVRDNDNPGRFEARDVKLGHRAGDQYVVEEGLHEGELVVSRGAFRIDSELQIRGMPSMMSPEGGGSAGHDHGAGAGSSGNESATAGSNNADHDHGHDHSQEESHATEQNVQAAADSVQHLSAESLEPVFTHYEAMWTALHSDDLPAWQQAAEQFYQAVAGVDWDGADDLEDLLTSGAGHAHHVSDLETARDHFFYQSQAMLTLAEAGLVTTTWYRAYCPMARRGDGAYWLQPDDTLLNPFYGSRMLRCGDILEAFEGGGHEH